MNGDIGSDVIDDVYNASGILDFAEDDWGVSGVEELNTIKN